MMTDPTSTIIRAAAAHALNTVNCTNVPLFEPHVAAKLRVDPTTGVVAVVDDDGAVRHGCTPEALARELRDDWQRRDRNKWFK